MLFHALFFYVTALTFYHSYREVSISWFTNYHLQGSSLDLSTVFEKKKKNKNLGFNFGDGGQVLKHEFESCY